MEKMIELTISDVGELTEGKKVTVSKKDNTTTLHMTEAIVIADPDSGSDGKIIILEPKSGYKIVLDSEKDIKTIFGNENTINIIFADDMGVLDISIIKEMGTETNRVINQDELCQYIKDRLDRLSKLTVEDIDLVLDMEMEYLQSKATLNKDTQAIA